MLNNENWLDRQVKLIGKENNEILRKSTVMLFGVGGVGGGALECLARSGIGTIICIDNDRIDETNINRQIISNVNNIGKIKVDAARDRVNEINPECKFIALAEFACEDNISAMISEYNPDFIIDAIDNVSAKLEIAKCAEENSISQICVAGTGNKLDPMQFVISDISETKMCPLCKVLRKEAKNRNIKKICVLWSEEEPQKVQSRTPASISFVPAAAGMMAAGYCIKTLIREI